MNGYTPFQTDQTTHAEQGTFQLPSACDLPTIVERVPWAQCSQHAWCAKNGHLWLAPLVSSFFYSMILIDTTFTTPAENLAFDEAMLEVADRDTETSLERLIPEVLRLWEMPTPCVVLGRASKWAEEASAIACERDSVPILRRVSGGASIVAGPGCLMYSVLLSYQIRPAWRMLDIAHSEVMTRMRQAVQNSLNSLNTPVQIDLKGTCDLTLTNRKFSGNALRCKRHWMLYHGTIMVAMPLEWITEYLFEPPRQPDYREKRVHSSFVVNLMDDRKGAAKSLEFRTLLEKHIAVAWNATTTSTDTWFQQEVAEEAARLMQSRYSDPLWHRQR